MPCVFCGSPSTHPVKFGGNFTAYNLLQAGDGACDRCHKKYTDSFYRRNSWYETPEAVKAIGKTEVLGLLLEPPTPPFRVYLTKMRRKHGWVVIASRWEMRRDVYDVAFEDARIRIEHSSLAAMIAFAKDLRAARVTKAAMRAGTLPYASVKALRERVIEIEQKLKEYKGNPQWNLVIEYVE